MSFTSLVERVLRESADENDLSARTGGLTEGFGRLLIELPGYRSTRTGRWISPLRCSTFTAAVGRCNRSQFVPRTSIKTLDATWGDRDLMIGKSWFWLLFAWRNYDHDKPQDQAETFAKRCGLVSAEA